MCVRVCVLRLGKGPSARDPSGTSATWVVPLHALVKLYHTDAEAPMFDTAAGSPLSSVARRVVPMAGSVVPAAKRASLRGTAQVKLTAMLTAPLAPFAPSTCRLYTVPCTMGRLVMQLAPAGEPPVVQLSLLAMNVRAFTAVPVYAARRVSKSLPLRSTCRNNVGWGGVGWGRVKKVRGVTTRMQ